MKPTGKLASVPRRPFQGSLASTTYLPLPLRKKVTGPWLKNSMSDIYYSSTEEEDDDDDLSGLIVKPTMTYGQSAPRLLHPTTQRRKRMPMLEDSLRGRRRIKGRKKGRKKKAKPRRDSASSGEDPLNDESPDHPLLNVDLTALLEGLHRNYQSESSVDDSDGDYFEVGEDGQVRLKKGKRKIDLSKLSSEDMKKLGIDPETMTKEEIAKILKVSPMQNSSFRLILVHVFLIARFQTDNMSIENYFLHSYIHTHWHHAFTNGPTAPHTQA